MQQTPEEEKDDVGALEEARSELYRPRFRPGFARTAFSPRRPSTLKHAWKRAAAPQAAREPRRPRRVRYAVAFLAASIAFFCIALGVVAYALYFGSNAVSPAKVVVSVQGPTTIAGGDTVPLIVTVTNTNPVAINDVTLEIDFPSGTRSAADVTSAYPRYTETIGTLASGETVTSSVKAILFGPANTQLTLPVTVSYDMSGSNALFQKKSSYALNVTSTPLSLSVVSPAQTTSGQPLSLTLTVRSNATVPISNVMVTPTFPFGFTVASSSVPIENSVFSLGTLAPGDSRTIQLSGTLVGPDNVNRVFHFAVGTATSATDVTPLLSYMTQDATVAIVGSFLSTGLSVNGETTNVVLTPGSTQLVTVSYQNTLATPIANASVSVALSGAIDYNSVKAQGGFYDSATRTVIFDKDSDHAFASLAPGVTGTKTFSFSTLPSGTLSPTVSFSVSVAGTRTGETNVPEQLSATAVETAKVQTALSLSATASRTAGAFPETGPIPPVANEPTTYALVFSVGTRGSAVAAGTLTMTLPNYVTYLGATAGAGSFVYDPASHVLTWQPGDLPQGGSARGIAQISLTPSITQRGNIISLTGPVSFSGYDRFAGAQVSATADAVTTELVGDPGYVQGDGTVQ